MGCGTGCLKCILIGSGIIFGIIGTVILAVGAFILVGAEQYINQYLGSTLDNIPYAAGSFNLQGASDIPTGGLDLDIGKILEGVAITLIVIGASLLIMSILGGIGACCNKNILLYVYAAIVLALLLVQLLLVILFFTHALDDEAKNKLKGIIKDDYGGLDAYDTYSLVWNVMMIELDCCGVDDYLDFAVAIKWDDTRTFGAGGFGISYTLQTPLPCCKFQGGLTSFKPVSQTCAYRPTAITSNYQSGCWNALFDKVKNLNAIIIGVLAGILVFQALCAAAAIAIAVQQKKKDGKVSP